MSEYGEPWEENNNRQIVDSGGFLVAGRYAGSDAQCRRAIDCVNALASVKNPAAVKAVIERTNELLTELAEEILPALDEHSHIRITVAFLEVALAQLDKEQT